MSLSEDQAMALVGRRVRIINPPPNQPELLSQTGVVAMIVDGTRCLIQLEKDGSAETIDADQIEVIP